MSWRKAMSENTKVGSFDIVRLKEDISLNGLLIKKGSVGVTQFVPFAGVGVKFEKQRHSKFIPIVDLCDLQTSNSIQYLFRNVGSIVRIEHIADEIGEQQ